MKIYVASRFEDFSMTQSVQKLLIREGHSITFDWTKAADIFPGGDNSAPIENRSANAISDRRGVLDADAVIALVPSSGGCGMWIEIGIALGQHKRVLLIGPSRTIFEELCERYASVDDAVRAL